MSRKSKPYYPKTKRVTSRSLRRKKEKENRNHQVFQLIDVKDINNQ